MFERFTDRARRVIVLAQEESRLLDHNYIGTEHILLGLIHEGEGIAAMTLEQLGVTLDAVRLQVEQIIGRGNSSPSGHIPFTPRAKKVLELSLREALTLGHDYISTEHLLLGLIREGEGVAIQVLVKLVADLDRVRQSVLQAISEGSEGESPPARSAVSSVGARGRSLATAEMMGSGEVLLALLGDDRSVASQALANLGVTVDAVATQLAALDAAHEMRADAGARRLQVRVEGEEVAVVLSDPGLAQALMAALENRHEQSGHKGLNNVSRSTHVVTNDDTAAAGFAELWTDVRLGIDQVLRRLGERPPGPSFDRSDGLVGSLRKRLSLRLVPTLLRFETAEAVPEGSTSPEVSPPTTTENQ